MGYDNEKTRVIGRREIRDDYPEEYNEFNNAYEDGASPDEDVDELAYIDEMEMRGRSAGAGFGESYEADYRSEYDGDVQSRSPSSHPKGCKKKPKKGLIIGIIAVLALVCAGGAFAFLSLNGTQDVEVDLISTMNEPEITGFDKEGQLGELTLNQDEADKIIAGIKNDEQKEALAEFFAGVEYVPDNTSKLTNGDKIKIVAKYDEQLAEAASVTVSGMETEYTVEGLKEDENKLSVETPQWYRLVLPAGDELSITCILLADVGTSVTLPIQFMYCQPGGAMSEMIDTSGTPDITYNGTGYFMEDGFEAPVGRISQIDNRQVVYSVKQYGSSFKITVSYVINDDGTLNIEAATGGEAEIPTGKYEPRSASMANSLGADN